LIFQGRRPAIRVKQPPRKLIALIDPIPAPASPEPDLSAPRNEDDAQKIAAFPVVVSASSVVPACPVNEPPGLTAQPAAAPGELAASIVKATAPAPMSSRAMPEEASGRTWHEASSRVRDEAGSCI
jgi:hypothetical protein